MRLSILLFFLIISALNSKAISSDSIRTKKGTLYVQGKIYNKQIYLSSGGVVKQITHYNSWEEITRILVSDDQQFLLVYHKSNKDPSRKLSVVELEEFKTINTIKPGYGGGLYWTKENNILLVWGCGSPCAMFRIYDSSLTLIKEGGGIGLEVFVEKNIILDLPVITGAEGIFRMWSLKDGKMILEISFKKKYGEYYCWDAKVVSKSLQVQLRNTKDDKIILENIPIPEN